jgi:hypothetical protein
VFDKDEQNEYEYIKTYWNYEYQEELGREGISVDDGLYKMLVYITEHDMIHDIEDIHRVFSYVFNNDVILEYLN